MRRQVDDATFAAATAAQAFLSTVEEDAATRSGGTEGTFAGESG